MAIRVEPPKRGLLHSKKIFLSAGFSMAVNDWCVRNLKTCGADICQDSGTVRKTCRDVKENCTELKGLNLLEMCGKGVIVQMTVQVV